MCVEDPFLQIQSHIEIRLVVLPCGFVWLVYTMDLGTEERSAFMCTLNVHIEIHGQYLC